MKNSDRKTVNRPKQQQKKLNGQLKRVWLAEISRYCEYESPSCGCLVRPTETEKKPMVWQIVT